MGTIISFSARALLGVEDRRFYREAYHNLVRELPLLLRGLTDIPGSQLMAIHTSTADYSDLFNEPAYSLQLAVPLCDAVRAADPETIKTFDFRYPVSARSSIELGTEPADFIRNSESSFLPFIIDRDTSLETSNRDTTLAHMAHHAGATGVLILVQNQKGRSALAEDSVHCISGKLGELGSTDIRVGYYGLGTNLSNNLATIKRLLQEGPSSWLSVSPAQSHAA